MKYLLRIETVAGGDIAVTEEVAEGTIFGGELTLSYSFDGADYKLVVGAEHMTQTRRGEVNLITSFKQGETTFARIYDGANGGSFPVCTKILKVRFDGGGCEVFAEYCFGDGETVRLKVRAAVADGCDFS